MNIFEKLSAISLEITNVNKNLSVGVGSSSYKAVGEADVLAAVKPAEAKYRVYSYPVSRKVIDTGVIESTNYKGEGKKSLFVRIEIIYRFVNMDKPDEYIDIVSYGDGVDPQDKTVGKAMTYGDKYALLKAYKIITGEDPDQDASEPLNTAPRGRGSNKPTATAPAPAAPAKKGVSPELVKELETFGVKLEDIAAKKKMRVEDLTDDIVKPGLIILRKRKEKEIPQGGNTTSNGPEGAVNTNTTPEETK